MIPRLLQLPDDESFFLLGTQGVGKTTLLKHLPYYSKALYISLLSPGEEQRFARNPDQLTPIVTRKKIADDFGNCKAICFSCDPFQNKLTTSKYSPGRKASKRILPTKILNKFL